MNCTEVERLLADYLGGELALSQCDAIDAHLAGCTLCCAKVSPLSDAVAQLRRLEPPVQAADLARNAGNGRRLSRLLLYAAVFLIGLATGRFLLPKEGAAEKSAPTQSTAAASPPATPEQEWFNAMVRQSAQPEKAGVMLRNMAAMSEAFSHIDSQ